MYLLTLTGVYDHGALGLFTDPKDAEDYARELYDKSDGHHGFRLQNLELDQKIEPEVDLGTERAERRYRAPFEEIFKREE